jgi:hypothetical protein
MLGFHFHSCIEKVQKTEKTANNITESKNFNVPFQIPKAVKDMNTIPRPVEIVFAATNFFR